MASNIPTRTVVLTGASSGIGLVAAKALAAQGWHVIGVGRDPARTADAERQIAAAAAPGAKVEMLRADLSSMSQVARLVSELAAKTDRIDVLVNNAGGTAAKQVITPEGNEAIFAGNHLGAFYLTQQCLPMLEAAAQQAAPGDTRIINVSSAAHEASKGLNWDDLQMLQNFVPMAAYCNAKLANVLFTRALAKRLQGIGIMVHAMHPGAVGSNFWSHADEATQTYGRSRSLITPEQGADTLIWLATAPEPGVTSGGYYFERKLVAPSAAAQDEESAERLWTESERLIAASLRHQALV